MWLYTIVVVELPTMPHKMVFLSTLSNSCIAFNVAIGFFNFKNSSQREASKKNVGHISIVMHDYVVRIMKK